MRPGTSARSLYGRIARLEVRQEVATPEITAEDREAAERIAARWGLKALEAAGRGPSSTQPLAAD